MQAPARQRLTAGSPNARLEPARPYWQWSALKAITLEMTAQFNCSTWNTQHNASSPHEPYVCWLGAKAGTPGPTVFHPYCTAQHCTLFTLQCCSYPAEPIPVLVYSSLTCSACPAVGLAAGSGCRQSPTSRFSAAGRLSGRVVVGVSSGSCL